jgi:hypothetical protein
MLCEELFKGINEKQVKAKKKIIYFEKKSSGKYLFGHEKM